ncbi:hypothetical protein ACQP2X_26340 [Actinoplanes sp. CA-131856]
MIRPGGVFVACAPSRRNDPEFASVLPGWGTRSTFDAEEAVGIVEQVFDIVRAERWDAPLISLPDVAAVAAFLRGRGLTVPDARRAARQFVTPMDVTKRGVLIWARHR